jgi:hypothetical protein
MRNVHNADEFLISFRKISDDYSRVYGPMIDRLRQRYAGQPEAGLLDNSLEAHGRVYFVNGFLSALNWRFGLSPDKGLPNLVPEVPIRSEERGTIRFLDYLGLESDAAIEKPLLVIETKRASAVLPSAITPSATYSEILSRGLAGEPLSGEWNTWINDLKDYVRTVHRLTGKTPQRVVLINTIWLIIFLDPSDAFLETRSGRDPNRILIFSSRDEIERRFNEIFLNLEYYQVRKQVPQIAPVELLFYLTPDKVDHIMHGLHIIYTEQPSFRHVAPIIKIVPVIFLRSRYGEWFHIESSARDFELPHRKDDLFRHLAEIEQAAEELRSEVLRQLGIDMTPSSLLEHYGNEEDLSAIPGVRQCRRDEFLIVTGNRTHYFLREPSVPGCQYHDWVACNSAGIASGLAPIVLRSVLPRSFFTSAEPHHCAHHDVESVKMTAITYENQARCGPRSGQVGQAFCELWCFEQRLCCRTCVFEEVCTRAPVFQLPCRREA